MNRELDAPGWRAVLSRRDVRQRGILYENIDKILGLVTPDHEPIPGFCDQTCGGEPLCTSGYLGLFQVRHYRYYALRAPCDPRAQYGSVEAKTDDDPDVLIQGFFTEEERARLNLSIKGDRIYQNT